MTLEEAAGLRQTIVKTYSEISEYLGDDPWEQLARGLRISCWICRNEFPNIASILAAKKFVAGNPRRPDGTPYGQDYVDQVWRRLFQLNRNPKLTTTLASRTCGDWLTSKAFVGAACTPTGRIRSGTSYTESRNTPFQSLASDGAKIALARLVLGGYRVVGFIHDEFIIELPDQGGFVDKRVVNDAVEVIRSGMQEVCGDVPVGCEYALATCWSKGAKLLEDGDRILPWSPSS